MICTLLRKPLNGGGGILQSIPCAVLNIDRTRVPLPSGTRPPRYPCNLVLDSCVIEDLDSEVGFLIGRGNRNLTFSSPGVGVIKWGLCVQPREANFDPGGYVSRFFKQVDL